MAISHQTVVAFPVQFLHLTAYVTPYTTISVPAMEHLLWYSGPTLMLDYVSLSLFFFLVRTQGLPQLSKRRARTPHPPPHPVSLLQLRLPYRSHCHIIVAPFSTAHEVFSLLRFAVRPVASSAWQLSFWRSRGWTSAAASHDRSFTIPCTGLVNNTAATAMHTYMHEHNNTHHRRSI